MIPSGYQPLVVASCVPGDGVIEFHTRTERIVLDNQLDVVTEVLRLSDGRTPLSRIAKIASKKTRCEVDFVYDVVGDLDSLGVLIDSRAYAIHAHTSGNNPLVFRHDITDEQVLQMQMNRPSYLIQGSKRLQQPVVEHQSSLRELLQARHSCRNFQPEGLSYDVVSSLCEMAYGSSLAPVPSGGGLYPLSVFVFVMRDVEDFKSGIYQYDPSENELLMIESPIDEAEVSFAFDSDTCLHDASAILVITGDLNRHPAKYSNRGYRYTLIEAGHVAQNIHLAAIEEGLGSLEYCGFNDEVLRDLIGIADDNVWPLVSVAVGKPNSKGEVRLSGNAELRKTLEKELVGKGKPINWTTFLHKETEQNPPFYTSTAHFKPGTFSDARKTYRGRIAVGTSPSRDLAVVKAIAEGYERYMFSRCYVDTIAPASELDERWVDPSVYTPLTEWQFFEEGLEPFNPNVPWQWVDGEDSHGERVHVPVDLVFYPYDSGAFGRKMCHRAHSNGCAAHSTVQQAKLNAVHELLERDAIARNWLLKESPTRIPIELIPVHWRKRVLFWHAQGWKVDVVNFSHSGVAIINVLARHDGHQPYLAQGSAASSVDLTQAIDKAFQEMEVTIYALSGWRAKRIPFEKVDSPGDHGQLYRFDDFSHQIEYLFEGEFVDEVPLVGGEDAIYAFDPIYVTVSSDSSPLQVVRALSSQLLPVNFGYGRDHIAHHTVKDFVDQSTKPFPHYLA